MKKILRVMSLEHGDKKLVFDGSPETAAAEKEAREVFQRLMSEGGTVFAITPGNTEVSKKVTSFEALGEESIAVGRIVGG